MNAKLYYYIIAIRKGHVNAWQQKNHRAKCPAVFGFYVLQRDQAPKYAFLTRSSSMSSAALPDMAMAPVSST